MTLNITQPEPVEESNASDNSDELNSNLNTQTTPDDSNELFG